MYEDLVTYKVLQLISELANLISQQGGGRVIRYHGTYSKALKELYPEVKFNMDRFKKTGKVLGLWYDF